MSKKNPFGNAEPNPFEDVGAVSKSSSKKSNNSSSSNNNNSNNNRVNNANNAPPPSANDNTNTSPEPSSSSSSSSSSSLSSSSSKKKSKNAETHLAPMSADEIATREAALRAREAALNDRERALDTLSAELNQKTNNWPFKCLPIAYNDIDKDITPIHRQLVRTFYYSVLVTWFALLWNWSTVLVHWGESGTGTDFIMASVYVLAGVPGSWHGWYKMIYKACQRKTTLRWAVFGVVFFCHIVLMWLLGLGCPGVAGAGLFVLLQCIAGGYKASAVFAAVDTGVCCLLGLFSFYQLKSAYRIWKAGGGSVEQIKGGLAVAAMEAV